MDLAGYQGLGDTTQIAYPGLMMYQGARYPLLGNLGYGYPSIYNNFLIPEARYGNINNYAGLALSGQLGYGLPYSGYPYYGYRI